MSTEFLYILREHLRVWLILCGIAAVLGLIFATVVSLLIHRWKAFSQIVLSLKLACADLTRLAPRRIYAISWLTFKEALQRRALHAFIVGIPLFMFAQWFLQSTDQSDISAKPYVTFVLTALRWMTIPVSLLLACWGLPQDIKDRSLHTVVTKPVRRSEILIGRIFGYSAMMTLVCAVLGVVGYIWIQRSTPARCRTQLVARVPIYAAGLSFYDRQGEETNQGINVGDVWAYRSYIEGGTKATAIWQFNNLTWDFIKAQGVLKFEYSFEAFRSYKGKVGEPIRFDLWLRKPGSNEKEDKIKWPISPPVQEFKEALNSAVIEMPAAKLEELGVPKLIQEGGKLEIEVACVDSAQYIGVARPDLFIRLPDRPFAVTFSKTVINLWLMNVLIIIIGCTGSCFLKGPVTTVLTFGLLLMGTFLRGTMDTLVNEFHRSVDGKVMGGGPLESLYRLLTQRNVMTPLDETSTKTLLEFFDRQALNLLSVASGFIPDFARYDTAERATNGFDINVLTQLIPAILSTVGFFIPCVILGYFALQVRELEAK